ncbi:DUF2339 domain-containing protein [Cohnella pontilimi]|uniref:DUF2339 domain-containing protein n=1 Tax=Cohnella pontilimi TaxID=2564100 RepID=A0A4U0FHS8_9BACL|nr:DUF2339 domain-containing protein [Cohnella pontilimi]TJY44498.1 DUF2339 domain-containing protein [Cohnella pontilimi]
MNATFRKHWTSLLGVLLILTAFVTLFKYSIDQGWITDPMKIGLGLLCGAGLCVGGLALALHKRQTVTGEIIIGLGTSLLYATFSFAGIYYELWSSGSVFIGMIGITASLTAYAYRFDSRLLMNISFAGGLLSPLLMQPATDQVFALFLYLLVLNAAFFFLSIAKGWSELRIAPFFGSWLLYVVYFFHFDPPTEGLWSLPLRYALAAFVFYIAGFMISSWKNNRCFDGWNLYLSLANGMLFGFWAMLILDGDLHYGYVLAFLGVIYGIVGVLTYRFTGKIGLASAVPMLAGLMLLLIAATHLGSGMETKPIVSVFLWGGIAVLLAWGARRYPGGLLLNVGAVGIWLIVGIYWYIVTWDTPRGEWFGTYIPFLNSGAAAWMLLSALGFYFSLNRVVPFGNDKTQELLSQIFALFAHLIVGGLLTLQIENAFEEYAPDSAEMSLSLTLSVVWGVYALLLFLWGAYRRQMTFRWFGSAVLLFVAFKAIFLDLSGEQVLYKVLVLLILGGMSFLATWINGKWRTENQPAAESENLRNDVFDRHS